jgi:excisionase family DNA binding protein
MRFLKQAGEGMDEYLTIREVAELTKYTVGTLRKFVLKRRIAFHKWGRALRFRRDEIELWMQSGAKEAVYLPDGETAAVMTGGEVFPSPEVKA